jgi:hypothetical protein
VHLVGFIMRIYHAARSSECQMQQHITKMAFKERPVPPITRISATGHKERAMRDMTSPSTFKEDNKDWHNNLTSEVLASEIVINGLKRNARARLQSGRHLHSS